MKIDDAERLGIKVTFVPTKPVAATPAAAPVAVPSIVATTQSPAQVAAALTPAYAEGRQARIEYEGWFTALPATGDYRDDATLLGKQPQPQTTTHLHIFGLSGMADRLC